MPRKAGLELGLPGRGSRPHITQEVVRAPRTGGAGMGHRPTPGCAETATQNSLWGWGRAGRWHLAGRVTGDDILVAAAALP